MPEYPYFPFYVKDYLADHLVIAMTNEQKGVYVTFLCIAWHETPPATLPQDDAILARYAGMSPDLWQANKHAVLAPFTQDGRRYLQKRLRREYDKLAYKSEKASESANQRWKSTSNANALRTHCERNARASGSGSDSGSSPTGAEGNGERGVKPDKSRPSTELEVVNCAVSLDLPRSDGEYMWSKWQGDGFKNNGKPMKDWMAVMRAWEKGRYFPSQKGSNAPPHRTNPAVVVDRNAGTYNKASTYAGFKQQR